MKHTLKNVVEAAPTMKAVLYARVSSKEQEQEGYSIPAQLKSMREYAAKHGISIAAEYVDVETAKRTGRTNFNAMVERLEADTSIKGLLVEKTDRLYRNLKDWVTIEELKVEIHLIKEGEILTEDSRSSAKFMHGIKVLVARNYIDNLSEEARKGMQEKAEQGVWPSKAPLGYVNTTGPDGKKVIAVDPRIAPLVTRLFKLYADGNLSVKQAAAALRALGLRYTRSGAPVPASTIHTILRNRIYSGDIEWNGRIYPGKHEPLVSRELWALVQGILDGRNAKRTRRATHNFAFSGLLQCGHCGCALVGEIKKGKYVYYHCTGYKGKCAEPYVREEVLETQFSAMLGGLHFDAEALEWVRTALRESLADEKREQQEALRRLVEQERRVEARIEAMYLDKLDGRISAAFFDSKSAEWRAEQGRLHGEVGRLRVADQSYLEDGVRILELAQNAQNLFDQQEPREKRRLLDYVVSNSSWKAGILTVTYRQPFDLIAEAASRSDAMIGEGGLKNAKSEIWLGY